MTGVNPPQVSFVPAVGVFVQTSRGGWVCVKSTGAAHHHAGVLASYLGAVPLVPETEVSGCGNCGGQQCMDCASRAHHDECVKDCPVCCADLTAPGLTPEQRDLLAVADQVRTSGEGEFVGQGRDGLRIEPAPDYVVDSWPTSLDPGNPEYWRQHAVISRHLANVAMGTEHEDALTAAAEFAVRYADRLDRERAEAEQEAADRKRAAEYADTRFVHKCNEWDECVWSYLAGIRAERARAAGGGA